VNELAVAGEAKELLTLCRTGRLYDIEKWIAEGKPLEIPVSRNARKKTFLEVAVETGFHSLVELIAKHDNSQASKNASLETAVSQSRLDLIELLVANGAEITSMPFADVLLNCEPKIIQFFLSHGADLVTGSPLAVVLRRKNPNRSSALSRIQAGASRTGGCTSGIVGLRATAFLR
jgi:hypothetical protein